MAAKLTVTTPQGTFSRKTDRPYTFAAVTGPFTDAEWRKRLTRDIAYTEKQAIEYRAKADQADRGIVDRKESLLADKYGFDGYAAKLREWADLDDQRVAAAKAELATGRVANGSYVGHWGDTGYVGVTWHARRDLAVKELDKRLGQGFSKIGIFPVNQ